MKKKLHVTFLIIIIVLAYMSFYNSNVIKEATLLVALSLKSLSKYKI